MMDKTQKTIDCDFMLPKELIHEAHNSSFPNCQAITALCEEVNGTKAHHCVTSSTTPFCKNDKGSKRPNCSYDLPEYAPTHSKKNFSLANWADKTYRAYQEKQPWIT